MRLTQSIIYAEAERNSVALSRRIDSAWAGLGNRIVREILVHGAATVTLNTESEDGDRVSKIMLSAELEFDNER